MSSTRKRRARTQSSSSSSDDDSDDERGASTGAAASSTAAATTAAAAATAAAASASDDDSDSAPEECVRLRSAPAAAAAADDSDSFVANVASVAVAAVLNAAAAAAALQQKKRNKKRGGKAAQAKRKRHRLALEAFGQEKEQSPHAGAASIDPADPSTTADAAALSATADPAAAASSSSAAAAAAAAAASGDATADAAAASSDPSVMALTYSTNKKKKKNQKAGLQQPTKAAAAAALAALAAANETDVKYYAQRYSLFSLFDSGCRLDRVGWFSVTPELIAVHQAQRCRADTIIDAYAGVGGNAIQFAFTCRHVIAIEIDPARLALAKINARVYGVAHRIEFVLGDYWALLPGLKADAVFLAPPWGGVDYAAQPYFDIDKHITAPASGFDIFQRTRAITDNIAYCLPRNIRPQQLQQMAALPALARDGTALPTAAAASACSSLPLACELEENRVGGKVKMMTAYFGQLVRPPESEQAEEEQGAEHSNRAS